MTVISTCEGIYGSCSALLSSSSCCYSDGVLSPRLKVCQSGGGYIFRHCQLEQEDTFVAGVGIYTVYTCMAIYTCCVASIIHSLFICLILYLSSDTRGGCVGDLVMVNGALNHAPHESDGVVCRGRDS